jgi:hypothetical protein
MLSKGHFFNSVWVCIYPYDIRLTTQNWYLLPLLSILWRSTMSFGIQHKILSPIAFFIPNHLVQRLIMHTTKVNCLLFVPQLTIQIFFYSTCVDSFPIEEDLGVITKFNIALIDCMHDTSRRRYFIGYRNSYLSFVCMHMHVSWNSHCNSNFP